MVISSCLFAALSQAAVSLATVPAQPPLATSPRHTAAAGAMVLIGSALGVAGVVTGAIGFLPNSQALGSACPGQVCVDTPNNRALFDHAQSFGWAANVLVVNGLLWAAGGVTWILADSSVGRSAPIRVAAVVERGAAVLFAGGSF